MKKSKRKSQAILIVNPIQRWDGNITPFVKKVTRLHKEIAFYKVGIDQRASLQFSGTVSRPIKPLFLRHKNALFHLSQHYVVITRKHVFQSEQLYLRVRPVAHTHAHGNLIRRMLKYAHCVFAKQI